MPRSTSPLPRRSSSPAARTFRNLSTVTERDELIGVAETASSGVVTPAELNERARRRPAEALETVPGLVVSQHSGEGKANQYYLRGFNIDHGTDLALSVAGMPINLPTHGHGQGYADLNFLIPELVSGIQYQKGTYAADTGDFSAAGQIRVNYLNVLDDPLVRVEAGGYGYGRVLAAASPKVGTGQLLVAAEAMGNDGPWERPDEMRRWNGLVRYSQGGAASGLSITGLFHSADWNSSDQIPKRAVDDGSLDRFGYVDRTSGGETHRFGGIVEWQRTTATGATHVEGYGFDYGLDLFSNFTYFLDDPENGDQFEQFDDRFVFGGRASHGWSTTLVGRRSVVTVGGEMRRDDIGTVGLYRTAGARASRPCAKTRSGRRAAAPTPKCRPGGRMSSGRRLACAVICTTGTSTRTTRSTAAPQSDGIVNPKFRIAFGPWRRTEFYASAGGGFHSNDGRGATIRRDPVSGDAVDPVDPLVRARGAEVGLRTLALPRLHTSFATWGLWLDSELLFIGDAGTTEASRPSRRLGFEWDADYRATPWLALDASVAYSQARFTDEAPGRRSHSRGHRRCGQRRDASRPSRPLERQPALAVLRSAAAHRRQQRAQPGSNLANAEVGFQLSRIWRVKVDLLNLFDSKSSDIDYFYSSRLQGEPLGGVDGIHFHPVEPFTFRVALLASF